MAREFFTSSPREGYSQRASVSMHKDAGVDLLRLPLHTIPGTSRYVTVILDVNQTGREKTQFAERARPSSDPVGAVVEPDQYEELLSGLAVPTPRQNWRERTKILVVGSHLMSSIELPSGTSSEQGRVLNVRRDSVVEDNLDFYIAEPPATAIEIIERYGFPREAFDESEFEGSAPPDNQLVVAVRTNNSRPEIRSKLDTKVWPTL